MSVLTLHQSNKSSNLLLIPTTYYGMIVVTGLQRKMEVYADRSFNITRPWNVVDFEVLLLYVLASNEDKLIIQELYMYQSNLPIIF